MREKNLVICDEEIRYADSLGENISRHEELSVKVYVCSNLENAIQLSKEKQIHIFVVDEKYAYEERRKVPANHIFILGRSKIADLQEEEHALLKYRCADEIIRELFEVYTEKTKDDLFDISKKESAKILSVYSPIHRVGKTEFAIALSRECAKRKKTLYINLEEYAGFEGADENGGNLGDLLYYMKQGNENLGMRLQAIVSQRDGVDYLLPIPMALDLKEISKNEWIGLLEQIRENSIYECVVLDVGESVQGLYSLLERCDRVYMPVLQDAISERKIKRYESNVERLGLTRLPNISYRFVMPENINDYAKIRAKEEC